MGHTHLDGFITVMCSAPSHEEWGIRTFHLSDGGWIASSQIVLRTGDYLRERGKGAAHSDYQLITAVGELAPEIPRLPDGADADEVFEAMENPAFRSALLSAMAERQARDVHERYNGLVCSRCGDNVPILTSKLDVLLDFVAQKVADGMIMPFITLADVRMMLTPKMWRHIQAAKPD